MKKFKYENTTKQANEVMCYAHSHALNSASLKELKEFLEILLQHFPHTKTDDGTVKPYDEGSDYTQQWRAAHKHVIELIADKKGNHRHRWLLGTSIATLLVLVATLLHSVITNTSETSNGTTQAAAATEGKKQLKPAAEIKK
ncbi:hypothetical protein [Pseudomonas sp.]|uniref:hypothetical protein n=1 Tax=Pseudomonas sp. TaxID=306 RepID=UPI00405458A9